MARLLRLEKDSNVQPGASLSLPLPRVFLGSVDSKGLRATLLRGVDSTGLIVACDDSNRLQVVHNQRLNKK
jgi:hypothetical protein